MFGMVIQDRFRSTWAGFSGFTGLIGICIIYCYNRHGPDFSGLSELGSENPRILLGYSVLLMGGTRTTEENMD